MGIGKWLKRLRAREDAAAVKRFEDRREREGDLSEGERFLAGEDRVGRDVDHELLEGEPWLSGPRDSDE